MRYLEVRRHTMRVKPGKHLSQEGVTLARRVGDHMGPFHRVVTSDLTRAFETAIAMGFAVDEQLKELSQMAEDVSDAMASAEDFTALGRLAKKGGVVARFAKKQVSVWRLIASRIPEGESGLVISHGGVMELGTLGSVPDEDFGSWGAWFHYCEGVRLSFDGKEFVHVDILRVS
ncbi:MAG: histidine phosphatase family protein [Chloroflexi bacterium]|nr:histidine phosphatase family protein [Chloroflexota bacterium]